MSTSPDAFVFTTTVEGNPVRIKLPPAVVVRAASTANIADLTACSTAMDGVTLVAGDMVLLKNQSTTSENGVYAVGDVAAAAAALTRVFPLETGVEAMNGTCFFVQSGTASGGEWWYLTNAGTVTVGTTGLTFAQFADSADGIPAMQAVDATLVSGTVTINTGIAVASTSEVIPVLIGPLTGTTNFGTVGELKSSRVAGAAGVGTVVVRAFGDDGALDADAAGTVRVIILTPVS